MEFRRRIEYILEWEPHNDYSWRAVSEQKIYNDLFCLIFISMIDNNRQKCNIDDNTLNIC